MHPFKSHTNTFSEDSLANAIMVRDEVLKITRNLPDHPEKFLLGKIQERQ
jgi:hypothetical protein